MGKLTHSFRVFVAKTQGRPAKMVHRSSLTQKRRIEQAVQKLLKLLFPKALDNGNATNGPSVRLSVCVYDLDESAVLLRSLTATP